MVRAWVSYAAVVVLSVIGIAAFLASINLLARVVTSITRRVPERYVVGRLLLSLILRIIGASVIAVVLMTIVLVLTYAIWG